MVNYGTYFAFNKNPDDWNTTLIPGKLTIPLINFERPERSSFKRKTDITLGESQTFFFNW